MKRKFPQNVPAPFLLIISFSTSCLNNPTVCFKVRSSGGRLYVCDSGNNMVKVFNEKSTEFLFEIKRSFQRPSAILVCEKRNELFIKDDNEVSVFNAENGEFLRSFGAAYLSRPYGLAFNQNGNIVLIDADLKNPLIYVIKKETGEVLSKKCFQPGRKAISDSDKLINQFSGGKRKILGESISSSAQHVWFFI